MEDFILKFAEAIETPDASALTPETKFRNLDDWSSFAALSIIALADEEYGKEISGADLKKTETIQDLYDLMTSK